MAVDNEVLEVQPAPRPAELVGAPLLASRVLPPVAGEIAQDQRPEFYLAADAVCRGPPREVDGENGEDLCRQTFEDQNAQGTDCHRPPAVAFVFPHRQWRPARWLHAA